MATATKILTKAQKRVLVAKDVLKWLKAGDIKAAHCYFESPRGPKDVKPDDDIREIVQKLGPCQVCGIGAALYSLIRRFDGLMAEDGEHRLRLYGSLWEYDVRGKLRDIFSPLQIAMIEAAFERKYHIVEQAFRSTPAVLAAAERFYLLDDDRKRMEAIFRNIIENQGTFRTAK